MPKNYTVSLCQVDVSYLASVRATVTHQTLGTTIRQILSSNIVYQFIADAELEKAGHNVIVYNNHEMQIPGNLAKEFTIEVGVQVASPFENSKSNRQVICSVTPQGRAATTLHTGPYDQLGQAHTAIMEWAKEQRQPLTGLSWEVYGDWHADVNQLTTEVYYLLK